MATFYPNERTPSYHQNGRLNTEINTITAVEQGLTNIRIKNLFTEFNKDGTGQALLGTTTATAVLADTTIIPIVDPDKRRGWCFTNTVAGTKYNLYYFNGTEEVMKLGDIKSLYARLYIDRYTGQSSVPFFHIYTKPTGVGDAGPFYHSRLTYQYDGLTGAKIGIGEEQVLYAINEPTKGFSNRKIQLTSLTVDGDGLPDEEVLYTVLGSNSSTPIGELVNCVSLLGFNTLNDLSQNNIERNFNLITQDASGNGATEAKQDDIITELKEIDGKISKGNDFTLTEAQQVLAYGEVTSGPQAGELHPIHITNGGDVEVEIADFKKGQENMLSSFPVVIASDQSTLSVSETFLRATQNVNFTVSATSNNTSIGINMSPAGNPTYRQVVIFGDTDNITDTEIHLQFSNDNSNWFTVESITLLADPLNTLKKTFSKLVDSPPQWVRLLKLNSTASLETVQVKTSRIN